MQVGRRACMLHFVSPSDLVPTIVRVNEGDRQRIALSKKVNNIRPEQRDQFSQLFTAQQLADKLKQDVFALAAPLAPHLTREQLEELLQSEEYTSFVQWRKLGGVEIAPTTRNGRMLGASVRYVGKSRVKSRDRSDSEEAEISRAEDKAAEERESDKVNSQDSQDYDSHADSASFEGDAFDSDDDVDMPWLEEDSSAESMHLDLASPLRHVTAELRAREVIGQDDPWVLSVMMKQREEIERVLNRQEDHVADQDVDLNINPEHVIEHEAEGESTTQLTRHVALLEQQQRLQLRRLIASHDTVQRAYKTYCDKMQQLEQLRAGKGRKVTGVIEELEQFIKQCNELYSFDLLARDTDS